MIPVPFLVVTENNRHVIGAIHCFINASVIDIGTSAPVLRFVFMLSKLRVLLYNNLFSEGHLPSSFCVPLQECVCFLSYGTDHDTRTCSPTEAHVPQPVGWAFQSGLFQCSITAHAPAAVPCSGQNGQGAHLAQLLFWGVLVVNGDHDSFSPSLSVATLFEARDRLLMPWFMLMAEARVKGGTGLCYKKELCFG